MQHTIAGLRGLTPAGGEEQRGASSVEYALLIALIAAAIVFAVSMLGLTIDDLLVVDLTP